MKQAIRLPAGVIWQCGECGKWWADRMLSCVQCGKLRQHCARAWQDRAEPLGRVSAGPDPSRDPGATAARCGRRPPAPGSKTEGLALVMLRAKFPHAKVTPHGLTLTFDDGARYTPDILVAWQDSRKAIVCYEVKGGYRGPGWEQGMERFQRARLAFPWLDLRLLERRKGGAWFCDGAAWSVA